MYNDIFTPNAPVLDVLARIRAAGYGTLLLSNTDPERFGFVRRRFPEVGLFDDFVLSYELKLLKPDPAIYRVAADRAGSRPDECVFIDDMEENVAGAVAAGFAGYPLSAGDGPGGGAPEARPPLLNRGHDTHFLFSKNGKWVSSPPIFPVLTDELDPGLARPGPSNSQKKTPCHVPSRSRPPSTTSVTDDPTSAALTWAGALPSACA